MYYYGTTPVPNGDGSMRCQIRRKAGYYVIVSSITAEKIGPYDLFMDKAGRVICQDVKNRRFPLSDLGAYEIRREVTYVN